MSNKLEPGKLAAAFKSPETRIIKKLVRDRLNETDPTKRISPQELADILDVSLSTIYRWWNGDDSEPAVIVLDRTEANELQALIKKLESVVATEDARILVHLSRQIQ